MNPTLPNEKIFFFSKSNHYPTSKKKIIFLTVYFLNVMYITSRSQWLIVFFSDA